MKKILLMLAVVMTLAFAACTGRQAKTADATEPAVEAVVEETCECCGADADTVEVETVAEEVVDAE